MFLWLVLWVRFLFLKHLIGSSVPALLNKFDLGIYSGKQVALKANFNSADPFPASTHIDTLRAIVETLKGTGAGG